MATKKVIILGGNDTSYQLQLGLLARQGQFDVSLVHDSNYIYTPSRFYPDLLAGNLTIRDAALENNKYFSSKVTYLRQPPANLEDVCVINSVTDAHNISILHLPHGRRRYFTLHNTDNVIMAGAEITQYKALLVFGATERALSYACAAAKAGFKTWLVASPNALINPHFDEPTSLLIQQLLQQLDIQLISADDTQELLAKYPALYTPESAQTPGLMRIRQQLNHRFDHYPKADLALQDGGDWYQLPLQATEQLINRIAPAVSDLSPDRLSYLWNNKPALPHRIEINNFHLHYAGELHNDLAPNNLTLSIPEQNIYRKIILQEGRIGGFVLAGDVRGSERLADMMMTHQNVQHCLDTLLYTGC